MVFTVRHEVVKVMFLHLSVCPQGRGSASVHAGIHPPPEQAPPWDHAPHPADGYGCRWYASYWNAFLLVVFGTSVKQYSLLLLLIVVTYI